MRTMMAATNILRAAISDTVVRINEDAKDTSEPVARLLRQLISPSQHLMVGDSGLPRLLEPDLDVGTWMKEWSESRVNLLRFHQEVGQPPGCYLWDQRMAIAARLTEEDEPSAELIAMCLGYSDPYVLSRSFQAWSGARLAAFTAGRRHVWANIGPPNQDFLNSRVLDRLLTGTADAGEVKRLHKRFAKVSALAKRSAEGSDFLCIHCQERREAKKLWRKLKEKPFSEQEIFVRCQVAFTTPALFKILTANVVSVGRRDRQSGAEIARLALVSVETLAQELGEGLHNLKAEAWLNIALASELAENAASAESALKRAEFEMKYASTQSCPMSRLSSCAQGVRCTGIPEQPESSIRLLLEN